MAGYAASSTRGMVSNCRSVSACALHYDGLVDIETSQTGSLTQVIRPVGAVDSNVWDFEIPPLGPGVFTNMSDLRVHFKARITKDKTPYADKQNVVCVNNIGQTAFKNVETKVNDSSLPGSTFSDAHIKAYLDTLRYSDKSMENVLECQGFSLDDAGGHDVLEETEGAKFRRELVNASREFDIVAPINSDFLKSQSYLGPGNKLSIRLERASDEQLIMCPLGDKARLTFTDMKLHCTRIYTEGVALPAVETHLIPQTEIMRFPMPASTTNIIMNVQKGGRLPRSVVVFFIKTSALDGVYTKNMLKMEHLKLTSLNLRVSGRSVPSEPLQPDFHEKKQVAREMLHMFQNNGTLSTGRTGLIDRKRFLDGFTIYPFDLTPDKCGGLEYHEFVEGTLDVEAKCEGMTEACTGFVYLTWDVEVAIDHRSGAPGFHDHNFVSIRK